MKEIHLIKYKNKYVGTLLDPIISLKKSSNNVREVLNYFNMEIGKEYTIVYDSADDVVQFLNNDYVI